MAPGRRAQCLIIGISLDFERCLGVRAEPVQNVSIEAHTGEQLVLCVVDRLPRFAAGRASISCFIIRIFELFCPARHFVERQVFDGFAVGVYSRVERLVFA